MQHHVFFTFSNLEDFTQFISFLKSSELTIDSINEETLLVECHINKHLVNMTLKIFEPTMLMLDE